MHGGGRGAAIVKRFVVKIVVSEPMKPPELGVNEPKFVNEVTFTNFLFAKHYYLAIELCT